MHSHNVQTHAHTYVQTHTGAYILYIQTHTEAGAYMHTQTA